MKTWKTTLSVAAVLAAMVPGAVSAQDLIAENKPADGAAGPESPWTLEVGAYGFVPLSVSGTSVVDGGAVDLDLGPEEIFDLIHFAVSGRGEAWRELDNKDGSAFGFVLDGQYVNLGLSEQNIGPAAGGTVKADIRQGIIDALVGYRMPTISNGSNPDERVEIDFTAGARYNYLRQKIRVTPGLPPPFTANLGGDKTWVSPVIGARANFVLNDEWNLVFRGDLSGFGVSGEDLSWSINGIAGYRLGDNATFRFGYRFYGIDYTDGSGSNEFGYDVTQHGPFLGLSYRF